MVMSHRYSWLIPVTAILTIVCMLAAAGCAVRFGHGDFPLGLPLAFALAGGAVHFALWFIAFDLLVEIASKR